MKEEKNYWKFSLLINVISCFGIPREDVFQKDSYFYSFQLFNTSFLFASKIQKVNLNNTSM